jgi:hypothetical protein
VLSVDGTGQAELPQLVAQVAVRAAEDPATSHYVLIVAPRQLDPSPTAAEAILATAHAFWSSGLTLAAATNPPAVRPADHGQLVPPAQGSAGLPPLTIRAAQHLTRLVPALRTMLSSEDADALLGTLPATVQRAESTAWRTDPAAGAAYAGRMSQRLDGIESGVHILNTGTYTLASSNAPLPVVIQNDLPVPARILLRVRTANGLPGFSAREVKHQIEPGQRVTVHVATRVSRAGRFLVQATLYTPSGVPISAPVDLTVNSTALGTIGVIITVVAAAVLVLALLVRFVGRMRNPAPPPGTEPPAITP